MPGRRGPKGRKGWSAGRWTVARKCAFGPSSKHLNAVVIRLTDHSNLACTAVRRCESNARFVVTDTFLIRGQMELRHLMITVASGADAVSAGATRVKIRTHRNADAHL